MNRRLFVQGGLSTLFVPNAPVVASALSSGSAQPAWDYIYFDERFAVARRLAMELAGTVAPTPVLSDVTGLWTGGLARASLVAPMALQGVTTESFYFCLKVLLSDQARVETQVRRIDRDLHLWTMSTKNHSRNGTTQWQDHFHPV